MLRALVLIVAVAMAAASGARAESSLRAVFEGDLRIIDPNATGAYVTRNFSNLVYDTLIAKDSSGEFKPQMLESWSIGDDGSTYTFRLRDKLSFHDGAPVTANDCVLTIKRWAVRDPAGKMLMAHTKSLDVVDDKVFKLTLSKPFAHVIKSLSRNVWVLPARLAATDPSKPLTEAVGSGPFVMKAEEWIPGDRVVLTRNPGYSPRSEPPDGLAGGKIAKVDRLEMRFIADQATRFAALKRGEVDLILFPSMDYLPLAQKDPTLVVDGMQGRLSKVGWIMLNHSQPPFDNVLVRRAFQYAIDTSEIISALGLPPEFATPDCRSIYSCGATSPFGVNAGAEDFVKPNIQKAKELLVEAGYKGEKIVSLHTTNIRTIEIPATIIEEQLRQAGFNVESVAVEWNTLMAKSMSKEPLEKGGWSFYVQHIDTPDLADPLTNPFITTNCSGLMPGWICDDKIRELQARYMAETDGAKAKAIAIDIQRQYMSSVHSAIWGQFVAPMFYRSVVKGVVPNGLPTFWNVSKSAP